MKGWLLWDVGNTRVKCRLERGTGATAADRGDGSGPEVRTWSHEEIKSGTWRDFFELKDWQMVGISVNQAVRQTLDQQTESRIRWLSVEDFREISVEFETVQSMGVDRVAHAWGAWVEMRSGEIKGSANPEQTEPILGSKADPLLVISCGTAITADLILPGPRLVGGLIAPGWRALGQGLGSLAPSLQPFIAEIAAVGHDERTEKGSRFPGRTSAACVKLGLEAAFCGTLIQTVRWAESACDFLNKENSWHPMGQAMRIMLTGGDGLRAQSYLEAMGRRVRFFEHLALQGLWRLVQTSGLDEPN